MRNPVNQPWAAALLAGAVLLLAPAAWPFPQSGATPAQKPSADQNTTMQQPSAPQDSDSVAEAARKAKAEKGKQATKKVITDDDLSSIKGDGVSVVGDEKPDTDAEKTAAEKPEGAAAAKPGVKDESYWRGRAKQIRDQMAAVDQEIEKTQDEIKKGGGAGFDAQSGLNQNVIYFEDRNTKLKKLEERKAQLQKQLEDLEDEARKASVPAGWVR
ncbi:MAG TPA: hypothetical protein VL099_04575 [Candidatus Binatia bacterium]|nr:hypothetical protein [Candidatus Binatia bacterium]